MALQMKTLKHADIGLALRNTVAAVHDMIHSCMLSFLGNLLPFNEEQC